MPSFSGKFQYLNPQGSVAQAGSCRVTFEAESVTLVPGSGAPLVFDLGDIDAFSPGDYELTLTLYTSQKILLHQFGKAFQNLTHDLQEAYRKRLTQCLLLEDLEEVARFDGLAELRSPDLPARAFSCPAEFRLYRSNLAVFPAGATAFQWRLADIDTVDFDEAHYAVRLDSAGGRLIVTKLAKRTREFHQTLQDAIAQLTEKSAQTVHGLFPFLTPDQFQQVAQLMKEGRAASLAKLKAIHPKTGQALVENVVDAKMKPYFDSLMGHVPADWLYTGFKLLRQEEQEEPVAEGPDEETQEPAAEETTLMAPEESEQPLRVAAAGGECADDHQAAREPILHWFFFPLSAKRGAKFSGNLVAWEATSRSGRATYFFRLLSPDEAGQLRDPVKAADAVDAAIQKLNRAIVLVNFRREPIYLPDNSLEIQPQFRRYAIACRKLQELRRLRASFLGRAIHTTPQAWEKQVEEFLAMM